MNENIRPVQTKAGTFKTNNYKYLVKVFNRCMGGGGGGVWTTFKGKIQASF